MDRRVDPIAFKTDVTQGGAFVAYGSFPTFSTKAFHITSSVSSRYTISARFVSWENRVFSAVSTKLFSKVTFPFLSLVGSVLFPAFGASGISHTELLEYFSFCELFSALMTSLLKLLFGDAKYVIYPSTAYR